MRWLSLTTSNEHIQLYMGTHEHVCGQAMQWPNNYCICTQKQYMDERVVTRLNMAGGVFAAALFGVGRAGPADDAAPYAMRHVYITMDEYCDVNDTSNECTHDMHLSAGPCRHMSSDVGPLLRERLVELLGR